MSRDLAPAPILKPRPTVKLRVLRPFYSGRTLLTVGDIVKVDDLTANDAVSMGRAVLIEQNLRMAAVL